MVSILETEVTDFLTIQLGRVPTSTEISNGMISPWTLAQIQKSLNVGQSVLSIDNTSNIQDALDSLSSNGGGILNLQDGTYILTENIIIPSGVTMIGVGPTNTILSGAGQYGISCAGSGAYTTGTITVASGVNITGSGTSWLANVTAGQSLFLGLRWYTIAAVTGDTSLILAEPYSGSVTLPSTYRIATLATDVGLNGIGIVACPGTGLAFTDCRRLILNNLLTLQNNVGISITNATEVGASFIVSTGNTTDGVQATSMALFDWRSVNSVGNGGYGFLMSSIDQFSMLPFNADGNTSGGVKITTGTDGLLNGNANGTGGKGFELVATCDGIKFLGVDAVGNTSDGLKLTATSDNCKVQMSDFTGNGGYGINIAAASCDNTIVLGNTLSGNSSGSVNNSGTSTLIRSNIGVADN